jgi:hypothetical protein
MKIRFIRKDIPVSSKVGFDPATMVERDGWKFCRTDIDHETTAEQAWLHVKNMDAEPADDEARALCQPLLDRSDKGRLLLAREAVAKGIHPDDLQAFYDGVILGYKTDGSYIPGPNWKGDDEDDDDSDA